jgi:hypothetical protein
MLQLHSRAVVFAAAITALLRAQTTAPGFTLAAADLLAAARLARSRGAQTEVLAFGYRLRDLAQDDPVGPFLIAAAHASLGPSFAKDVALHAFARVLALTGDDLAPAAAKRLLAISVDYTGRAGLDALRSSVRAWQADLSAGKVLLLAPDKTTLVRASARADRRVEQVAGWAAAERAKLQRVRQQKKAAERALQRERTRKRALGEGFRDLQPYLDRIASCARTISASERALRDHETDLKALRAEAKRLAGRLAQLE